MTKVAIVGGLARPEFFSHSDYDEVWGMNGVRFPWVQKWDQRFNLHPYSYLETTWKDGLRVESSQMLKEPETPLYVIEPWPSDVAPTQIIFPRNEMSKIFRRPNYHCCVVDWMIAFALYSGVTSIGMHGIGLALQSNQPLSAKACTEYWCGVAEGMGVKIEEKGDCELFVYLTMVKSNASYGYDKESLVLMEDRTIQ